MNRLLGSNEMKLIMLLLAMLMLFGCAMNVNTVNPVSTSLKLVNSVDTSFEIAKAQYYAPKDTYYIWEKDSPNIHIFRGKQELNIVGGLGFQRDNFQKLSDIGMGVDGSLFGLDELARSLKRFDTNGMWLLNYDVSTWAQEPTKFAIDKTNQIYLYDDIQREFTFSSALRPEEMFKFGKFQVTDVQQISINYNQIIVYEPGSNQTSFFTLLGEYVESRQGQIVKDDQGNMYRLDSNYVTFIPSDQTAASSLDPYVTILTADSYLLTTTAHQVQLWQIFYGQRH
jgi:hypothetical protein